MLELKDDGTLEAIRIGLESMRKQRDDLDKKIRGCERFLKCPTKALAGESRGTIVREKVSSRKKYIPRTWPLLSTDNIRGALYSSTGGDLYCRGEIVSELLSRGAPMKVNELSERLKRTNGIITYAVRSSPKGLFHVDEDKASRAYSVNLTPAGIELSRAALSEWEEIRKNKSEASNQNLSLPFTD